MLPIDFLQPIYCPTRLYGRETCVDPTV